MSSTRRRAALSLLASPFTAFAAQAQQQRPDEDHLPIPPNPNDDRRMPDGRSQKLLIAKEEHEQALKEARDLVALAEQLRDEIDHAGNYVVPVSSVKKTEDIERLARKIRGRLRY